MYRGDTPVPRVPVHLSVQWSPENADDHSVRRFQSVAGGLCTCSRRFPQRMLSWIIPEVEVHAIHDLSETETKVGVRLAEGTAGAHGAEGPVSTEFEAGPRLAATERECGLRLQHLVEPSFGRRCRSLGQSGERFRRDSELVSSGCQIALHHGDRSGGPDPVRCREFNSLHLRIVVAMRHTHHFWIRKRPRCQRTRIQEGGDKGTWKFRDVEHHLRSKPVAQYRSDAVIRCVGW
jgi:hypothetical protein